MPIKRNSYKKPAPRWFRLTKKIVSLTLNTVILVLLALGYSSESVLMLLIKIGESYLGNLFDTILSNGEVYAPDNQKPYSAPNDRTV